jgi:hypothetical protein
MTMRLHKTILQMNPSVLDDIENDPTRELGEFECPCGSTSWNQRAYGRYSQDKVFGAEFRYAEWDEVEILEQEYTDEWECHGCSGRPDDETREALDRG